MAGWCPAHLILVVQTLVINVINLGSFHRQGTGCGDGAGLFWGSVYVGGTGAVYESGSRECWREFRESAVVECLLLYEQ